MSITEAPPKKSYMEALNEVLSIQKCAIQIASNKVYGRLTIHKEAVDEVTLDFLSIYFGTSIKPADENYSTGPYVKIHSDDCDIIVMLKTEKNEF